MHFLPTKLGSLGVNVGKNDLGQTVTLPMANLQTFGCIHTTFSMKNTFLTSLCDLFGMVK